MWDVESLVDIGRLMESQRNTGLQLAAEWLRVRDRQGHTQPLVANAAQRTFEEQRGRQNIVLKARQMGMTTWVAGRFFLRTITKPGTLTVQVAHTRAAAEAIYTIVERMWRGLPEELRDGPLRRSRANVGQMVFPELGSEFRAWSAADDNAGRGLSIQNLHCSEVSRWPGNAAAETLAGLRAALAPNGELVLESTPNGSYGTFYEEWQKSGPSAESESNGLVRHFLPWWLEPAYIGPSVAVEQMTAEELVLLGRHGLTPEQIGYRRGLERTFGILRSQEFAEDAETCFRATGDCCFNVDAIEQRLRDAPEPVERRRNGALQVWLPAVSGKEYCVAVDTAGGGPDGDFAAVQVVEMTTGLQCAELQERLRPDELARVTAALAREYNGALVAVERNNHGAAVLAYLESRERYERLYRQRGEAGWLTTAASKPEMVARLAVMLSEASQRFMSRRLLGECRTFVSGERGRFSAANGAHDDLVMSMCVALAVREERVGV